jgi:uncharacterized protein (TIGR00304 family)
VVDLVSGGLILVLIGVGVMMAAVLIEGRGHGGVKGAGVVMIGPIPIIFGSDAKWASVAIVLAILLVLLVFVLSVA